MFARGGYLVSSFFLFVVLVRQISTRELSELSLGFSWLAVLIVSYDFGLNEYTVRLMSGFSGNSSRELRRSLVTKAVLIAAVTACYLIIATLVYHGTEHLPVLLAIIPAAAARSLCDFAENALIATGRGRAVAQFAILQAVMAFCVGLLSVKFLSPTATMVFGSQASVYMTLGLIRLYSLGGGAFVPGEFSDFLKNSVQMLIRCAPFGGLSVGAILFIAAPVIILSLLPQAGPALASFQAAQRIWTTAISLGQGPFTRLYAIFSERFKTGEHQLNQRLANRMILSLGALGIAISLGTVVVGKPILHHLYTAKLAQSYDIFLLLVAALPFGFLAYIPGAWLSAYHFERLKLKTVLVPCAALWIALWLCRDRLTVTLAATLFTLSWIAMSVWMWWLACRFAGLRTGWLAPQATAVAAMILILASIYGGKLAIFGGATVCAFALAYTFVHTRSSGGGRPPDSNEQLAPSSR